MDQAVTARTQGALAFALLTLSGIAVAQTADPTRPPAQLYAPVSIPGATYQPDIVAEPRVQSILVSLRRGGRRIAVIDGKTVRPGDRIGSAVVAAINSTEVILKRGSTTQTLKLFRPAPRNMIDQP